MNKSKLLHIITQDESETLEFKTSFNKEVIETIVAFSNKNGGKIVLGVNNEKEIKGVLISNESIQKWMNEIKQKTEPAIIPSVDKLVIDDKTIVIFSINEFPIKPISYNNKFFIRVHNSNHKLTADQIVELRFNSLNYSFDAFEVATKFEQLDKKALQYFSDKVGKSGRYKLSDNSKLDLIKLGIIKNNKLTRAAELLYGLHHTNIHIGRFKSETTIIDDLMIRSPLILAVDEAIEFIKKNIRLGFEFGGETTKRTEKWQYPIPAIREFLLNAIVHRDYSNPTDVIIKIYDENIEITNPGKLMGGLTVEKLNSGNYLSIHRNKLITEAFYLTGDIEKYGTGFKRIKRWFKEYPDLKYQLHNLSGFIKIKISTINEPVNEGIKNLLEIIERNEGKRTNELATIIDKPAKTIERWLAKLKKNNLITYKGSKKTGGYWKT